MLDALDSARPTPAYEPVKRIFDVVGGFVLLLLGAPLILVSSLAVRLSSRGPVFFGHVRCGRGGEPFRCLKLRTMVVGAEKIGGSSTADDDPRITKIGKFLRKYKLDELPQLFNVLKGEMSFVGPRPEVQHYVDMFTEEEKVLLSVRPGITDWASLWNPDEGAVLAGSLDPEKTYMEEIRPTKLRLQLKYVKERSFCVDLSILADPYISPSVIYFHLTVPLFAFKA